MSLYVDSTIHSWSMKSAFPQKGGSESHPNEGYLIFVPAMGGEPSAIGVVILISNAFLANYRKRKKDKESRINQNETEPRSTSVSARTVNVFV